MLGQMPNRFEILHHGNVGTCITQNRSGQQSQKKGQSKEKMQKQNKNAIKINMLEQKVLNQY